MGIIYKGEAKLIASSISERLLSDTRIILLNREERDKVLSELDNATSELISKHDRLMPELYSANLILFIEYIQSFNSYFARLKLIQTNKNQIIASISPKIDSPGINEEYIQKIADKTVEVLNKEYWLRGKIIDIIDKKIQKDIKIKLYKEIILNIGSESGVDIGQTFKVPGKEIKLKIIKTEKWKSTAKIIAGKIIPEKGWPVECIKLKANQ